MVGEGDEAGEILMTALLGVAGADILFLGRTGRMQRLSFLFI